MKIAYFSNYKENSGFSEAARNYIRALDLAGCIVTPRNIYLQNQPQEEKQLVLDTLHPRIKELEQNNLRNVDVAICHTLPSLASTTPKAKNVLMYAIETSHHRNSNWAQFANRFDAIGSYCKTSVVAIKNSGVNVKKLFQIPHCVDTERPNNPKLLNVKRSTNKCIFLSINEYSTRKNSEGLLRAFLSEFTDEPVCLFMKTFVNGGNPQSSSEFIRGDIARIRKGAKLKSCEGLLPEVVVCTDKISPLQIDSLLAQANFAINVSYGESFGLNVFDGINFGLPFIASDSCAYKEYLSTTKGNDAGWLVSTSPDIVWDVVGTPEGLYTASEQWDRPNLVDLKRCMREAYNLWRQPAKYKVFSDNAKKLAQKFSLKTIGENFKEILEKL